MAARDDVARRQFGVGMQLEHEPFAEIVDERRAFAAHGLGDERHRVAADRERGRMKLHELHIGQQGACARGHCDAVAGCLHRIGREAIEAPDAAAGEHDCTRAERDCPVACVVARVDAADAIAVDDEIGGRNLFDDLDRRVDAYRIDQRLENLVTGRVAAGLDDAAALVRGFAPERQLARVGAVERRTELE